MNSKRRHKARRYIEKLKPFNDAFTYIGDQPGRKHMHQMFNVIVHPDIDRDSLVQKLNNKKIEASVHFTPPLHKQYNDTTELPVTDFVSNHIMSLPMYPDLSSHDIDYIVDTLSFFI